MKIKYAISKLLLMLTIVLFLFSQQVWSNAVNRIQLAGNLLSHSDTIALPFTEDWSSGNFSTNHWEFDPEQGNWDLYGNNYCQFKKQPRVQNYSYSLVSP